MSFSQAAAGNYWKSFQKFDANNGPKVYSLG